MSSEKILELLKKIKKALFSLFNTMKINASIWEPKLSTLRAKLMRKTVKIPEDCQTKDQKLWKGQIQKKKMLQYTIPANVHVIYTNIQ